MNELDPRAELRAAIAVREAAEAKAGEAAAVQARAAQLLAEARADVERLASVDAAITTHRIAGVRASAMAGGAPPTLELPPELAERQRAKANAEAHAATMQAAHDQLADETAALARPVEDAATAVLLAAVAVLRAEMEELTTQLAATNARTDALRARIAGFGGVHFVPPGETCITQLGFSPTTSAVFNQFRSDLRYGPGDDMARRCDTYLRALMVDAGAQFEAVAL